MKHYLLENKITDDTQERITVPAENEADALAFANRVMPHDSKWVVVCEVEAPERD